MKKIKGFKTKLVMTVAVLIYAAIMYVFKIPCIILKVTGVSCLGCGMTRAFLSALRLDFVSAFSYHKMFWSLPILYLMVLYDGEIFKNKCLNALLMFIMVIGFIVNWLFCTK